MTRRAVKEQLDRAAIATVAADLAALQRMTGSELAEKYLARSASIRPRRPF
jgi:hypothetical protein